MRDFDWNDYLWCVVKEDGTFAGVVCTSWEEARELAAQHEGSRTFLLEPFEVDCSDEEPWYDEDTGFDPYMGCYTDDC